MLEVLLRLLVKFQADCFLCYLSYVIHLDDFTGFWLIRSFQGVRVQLSAP